MGCIRCVAQRQQKEQRIRELKEKMRLGPVSIRAWKAYPGAPRQVVKPVTKPVVKPVAKPVVKAVVKRVDKPIIKNPYKK